MKDLVPFESYSQGLAALPMRRLAIASGALFGFFLAGIFLALAALTHTLQPRRDLPLLLVIAVVAGLGFGSLLSGRLKRRLILANERVYHGRGKYSTPLPDPSLYTHRLPSSLRRSGIAVGGVLYVGRREALFQPHSMNLPSHRNAVLIAHDESCAVALVQPRSRPFSVLFGEPPPPLVEISCGDSRYQLVVPAPELVRNELARLLGG